MVTVAKNITFYNLYESSQPREQYVENETSDSRRYFRLIWVSQGRCLSPLMSSRDSAKTLGDVRQYMYVCM